MGLGAVLQQRKQDRWTPINFASRKLSDLEKKYSTNELELLAVVWAIENYRNYVEGEKFNIVTDHKALATILKGNKGNKTYSSRLTRWVDRLLPFDFEIEHAPGRTMGLADYLSRYPSNQVGENVRAESLWNNWFTVNIINEMNKMPIANKKVAKKAEPIVFEIPVETRERENSSGHLSGVKSRSNDANQMNTVYIINSNLNRISASFESKPVVETSLNVLSESTMQ